VAGSLKNIDFNESVLIAESYQMSKITGGGFGLADLRDLSFPEYEKLISIAVKESEERDGQQ
jgi:hypothetical protein